MIVLYIINTLILIVAVIAIILQFLLIHKQHEMNDMNSFIIKFNELITSNKCYIRETDCSIRQASIHTALRNGDPILMIDLIEPQKK